jgi:glucokinase
MRYAIGMDVGGTSVRVALVREDGHVVDSCVQPTGFDTPTDVMLGRFRLALEHALRADGGAQAEGVGVGMPGLQDEQGRVESASNLPSLNGVDLRGEVSRITGLPAAMENDMNTVALGEYHFGGHRVNGNLLVVYIGTGVGAALVQRGRLLRVASGCLGDPGHVLVERDGRLCRCGARGCLEAYASGWALLEQAAEMNGGWPEGHQNRLPDEAAARPAQLFSAAGAGHPLAAALVAGAGRRLGMGLASFCALYQPERIVLGGNVLIEASQVLLSPAIEQFRQIVQPWLHDVPMPLSTISGSAGALGGAALVLHHWDERLF